MHPFFFFTYVNLIIIQELFQGRVKGFDVEKALSSKSLRDFDKAISMVSYGFESIEDFYSESSTRAVVGNVKIPVLFIQVLVFQLKLAFYFAQDQHLLAFFPSSSQISLIIPCMSYTLGSVLE